MKKNIFIFFSCFAFSLLHAQDSLYREQYRPQFHFSPQVNWTNDPNGLVYHNGEYHLFYQNNPFENKWGHMTWAHATSKDLVHWKHLPIAIPEENGIMIFSGTCVADEKNTSGFGTKENPPMVAIYTGSTDTLQTQNIAYSLDNGVTWKKYAHNPIIDLHKKDFRDPKVFWYEPSKQWLMCVMYPVEHEVKFYNSKNLINWNYMSSFGPLGDTSSVWECPDLFQVPVEREPTKKKWLLTMSMAPSMQYFVGEFDGKDFHNENPSNKVFRPDYGGDYYAAIAYNQLPASQPPTMTGWINNWNYANDIPTTPWKGAMSLPRNISVKKINGEWILVQHPVNALKALRLKPSLFKDIVLDDHKGLFTLLEKSHQFEMQLALKPGAASISGVQLAVGNNHYFEIGYNAAKQKLYIDRSHCANQDFNPSFKKMHYYETNLTEKNGVIQLHIFFDNSIVEIFANDGEAVMTAQIFPGKEDREIQFFSRNDQCLFSEIQLWEMQSAWK